MTEKDKAAQRSTLLVQLGKFLAPLDELVKITPPPPASEYLIVAARCQSDCDSWQKEVTQFVTFENYNFKEVGKELTLYAYTLMKTVAHLARDITDDTQRLSRIKDNLETWKISMIAAIDSVPIKWIARLHEAQTPFSVYLNIRDAIGTAKRRVHCFDRYLDTDFFHLFMRDLNRGLEVRLVTTKGNANFGVTNVLPVSKLAAREFTNFKLIECQPSDLHDRNLRIDDLVFSLGPSIKDAGTQPTNFSPGDGTPNGHSILDAIMTKGIVAV